MQFAYRLAIMWQGSSFFTHNAQIHPPKRGRPP